MPALWGGGPTPRRAFRAGNLVQDGGDKILELEKLKAIALALSIFAQDLWTHHVQVLTDNATAVAYLNRQGVKGAGLYNYWQQRSIFYPLSVIHLKGTLNRVAGFLSRYPNQEAEWSLNLEVFMMISSISVRLQGKYAGSSILFPKQSDGSLGTNALAHP